MAYNVKDVHTARAKNKNKNKNTPKANTKPKESFEIGGKRKTSQINAKYALGLDELARKRVTGIAGKSDW